MSGRGVTWVLSVSTLILGCRQSIPEPRYTSHVGEDAVVVPYPPPAARAERVDKPPTTMKNPIWIDGQWLWRGRRWIWDAGGYHDALPDEAYAPPTLLRISSGELVWYEGHWETSPPKP